MQKKYDELLSYISGLEIVDTHEHLPFFEDRRNHDADVISEYLSQYFIKDLVSAGLPARSVAKLHGKETGITEKWNIVAPYWDLCKHTGYGQSLSIAARDIYGIGDINAATIEELNHAFRKGLGQRHFEKVLKKMCRIKVSILDDNDATALSYEERLKPPDPAYFIPANRIDNIVYPKTSRDIAYMEQAVGMRISRFDHYLDACRLLMERFAEKSKILKCALAYERSLLFRQGSYHDAEKGFGQLRADDAYDSDAQINQLQPSREMQDYVMHFLLDIAQKQGMVLQIHTGMQEGNGNLLENCNPALLNRLFQGYPDLKFDVFHIGYPFQNRLGVFGKWYPNVWIDMCWAHIISPGAAQNALSEWLEMLPVNKILGFGGDYSVVDGVYGHLCVARSNIAAVLARKVEQGLFGMDEAKEIARKLLFDTPAGLYGISP